jgi:hypothetical protein
MATVKPISDDKSKQDFGAIITGIDIENLNGEILNFAG